MSDIASLTTEILAAWGFSKDAGTALTAHAQTCAQYSEYRIEDIAVALSLLSREQADELQRTRPQNVLMLEHLSQNVPSVREQSLRIAAVARCIPYFTGIDEALIEGARTMVSSAASRLDEFNAAMLLTPDGVPLVVFSDLANLLVFAQAGRIERATDPIRVAAGTEPLVALAPPTIVARAARGDGTGDMVRVVSSAAQDNFWSPNLARTDAERMLARILDEALTRRATDIEFAPLRDGTVKIRFRIFGDLTSPERHALLNPDAAREIVNFLVSRSRAGDGARLRRSADGQLTYKNAATETFIRASFIPADRYGLDFDMISVSLRLMPRTSRSITLTELNLSATVTQTAREALMRTQGLIVLAGPTNSGKSTTIAGIVGEHLKLFGATKKRLSLEDPVERYLDGITQISVDGNFAELMRAMLRHDPDMVWVGEIRDAFSAAACVRAATSGHVVLSTVHANNSILAFRAISNYLRKDTGEQAGAGASLFDLAESVSLLIGQRLVKRLCPHCRKRRKVTEEELQLFRAYLKSEAQDHLWERAEQVLGRGVYQAAPTGCKHCQRSGYLGEMPVNEVLPVNREVRDLFSASESRLDFNGISRYRLNTLSEAALELVERGDTEFESLFI